jgi:CO/xanthine dehydrogenase FAD-binding subunit
MVRHIIPNNLNEALNFLNEGPFHIMAGGTDLMIQKRSTAGTPPKFAKDVFISLTSPNLIILRRTKPTAASHGAAAQLEDIL